MTNWTDFVGDEENGVLISVADMQQIIDNTSNIYERITVLESLKGGITPVGAIMLWYGTKATIPFGFQLADGTNGTPDLRGKFAMGIAASETDDNLLGTGGVSTHTHDFGTISDASKHTHAIYLNNSSAMVAVDAGLTGGAHWSHNHSWSAVTSSNDEHTHIGSYNTQDNLPPYTKYYWIARIPA